MKKTLFLLLPLTLLWAAKGETCGHEGWYGGAGYLQMLSFSPDNQLTASGGTRSSGNVTFRTRYGGAVKVGRDYCGSRLGFEIPFSTNAQRLNRQEIVDIFGLDVNAVIHLVETPGGLDFYWIAGTGVNVMAEGPIENDTSTAGINLNTGPGLNLFLSKDKKGALNLSVPLKYTLYFGNNLSRRMTQVLSVPVHLGFTVKF